MRKTSALLLTIVALASSIAMTTRSADAPAKTGIPNYQLVAHWPQLPSDAKFGGVSAVATDSADRVYVFHRGKKPIMVFDRDGKYLRSWGDDQVKTAHGLRVDRDNQIWTTDIGNQLVRKYSAEGKLLLTLGKKDQPGAGPDQFNKPTDVAVTASGDFYVSDGYGNSRIVKFSKDGKYLKEWGKKGTGESEFNIPHVVCLDDKGRVYVGDRENNRVQVFDADGKYLTQWKESGAPYGLFLHNERAWVADGRASLVKVLNMQGEPLGRFGEKDKADKQAMMPHWVCVDSKGAVYVADVSSKSVRKYVVK